ncbi:hypothetical protein O0235_06075 [Tepidiforma flava]|uniref:Uncharacterized protein n=1 Tax=Tepidiforma flava TaxID=3004094 RepID=A0ABY7M9B6_9CHLR|nr:hypothetical protein [Tepidiforma flava]WBL37133.1 hypothetical protein O0235_06075 [Tepidiforma flava]
MPESSCVTEVAYLVARYAFDVCTVHSLTVRRPTFGTNPAGVSAPILRGEWPALRASLEARLAG